MTLLNSAAYRFLKYEFTIFLKQCVILMKIFLNCLHFLDIILEILKYYKQI